MTTKTAERKTATPRTATRKPAPAPARAADSKPTNKHLTKARSAAQITPIAPPAPHRPTGASKQARLIALLGAAPGATVRQMMRLAGWQAHTVRRTISGVLRRRLGLNVACEAAAGDGTRVYRIVGAGTSA